MAPGWEGRSIFETREGRLSFHHFDLHAQALAKVERGHAQDRADVHEMVGRGLVDPGRARAFFEQIRPDLFRFPAVDAVDGVAFGREVDEAFGHSRPPRS